MPRCPSARPPNSSETPPSSEPFPYSSPLSAWFSVPLFLAGLASSPIVVPPSRHHRCQSDNVPSAFDRRSSFATLSDTTNRFPRDDCPATSFGNNTSLPSSMLAPRHVSVALSAVLSASHCSLRPLAVSRQSHRSFLDACPRSSATRRSLLLSSFPRWN